MVFAMSGYNGAESFAECANAAVSPPFRRQIMSQTLHFRGGHGEAKLVIVTACQRELASAQLTNCAYERFRDRNVVEHDLHATTARLRKLSCVTEQAIRYIDTRCGIASQAIAESQAR